MNGWVSKWVQEGEEAVTDLVKNVCICGSCGIWQSNIFKMEIFCDFIAAGKKSRDYFFNSKFKIIWGFTSSSGSGSGGWYKKGLSACSKYYTGEVIVGVIQD